MIIWEGEAILLPRIGDSDLLPLSERPLKLILFDLFVTENNDKILSVTGDNYV
jgi:hypothetical protein